MAAPTTTLTECPSPVYTGQAVTLCTPKEQLPFTGTLDVGMMVVGAVLLLLLGWLLRRKVRRA